MASIIIVSEAQQQLDGNCKVLIRPSCESKTKTTPQFENKLNKQRSKQTYGQLNKRACVNRKQNYLERLSLHDVLY